MTLADTQDALRNAAFAESLEAPPPAEDDQSLIGWLRRWDHAHPGSFTIASDHRFECKCLPCISLLVMTGLEETDPDGVLVYPDWAELRAEPVTGAEPTQDQIDRTHRLCARYL